MLNNKIAQHHKQNICMLKKLFSQFQHFKSSGILGSVHRVGCGTFSAHSLSSSSCLVHDLNDKTSCFC